jgi:hypothetical protein
MAGCEENILKALRALLEAVSACLDSLITSRQGRGEMHIGRAP